MAVSTTGLIAGADNRNASAAEGVTPRRTKAPATGTDAHSQPGSTAPANPATGTASAGCFGNARAKNDGGTNTAKHAESTTPMTRNGSACTTTATNTVIQLCIIGVASPRRTGPCTRKPISTTRLSTSTGLGFHPRRSSGSRWPVSARPSSTAVTADLPTSHSTR